MKKFVIALISVIVVAVVTAALVFLNMPKSSSATVTSLHINSSTVRLESDMSKRMSITVNPQDVDKNSYKLVSENEFVVVCEGNSVVAVNEGEAFVYAESLDGKVKSNKVKVIVSNNIFEVAAKIIMTATDAEYHNKELSEEVKQIKELIEPEDAKEIEEVEVTPEKASQITETEVKDVPETFEVPVVTEENAGEMVYVTKSGSKFHLSTCTHAKEATAISRSQAVNDGKEPCKKCNP